MVVPGLEEEEATPCSEALIPSGNIPMLEQETVNRPKDITTLEEALQKIKSMEEELQNQETAFTQKITVLEKENQALKRKTSKMDFQGSEEEAAELPKSDLPMLQNRTNEAKRRIMMSEENLQNSKEEPVVSRPQNLIMLHNILTEEQDTQALYHKTNSALEEAQKKIQTLEKENQTLTEKVTVQDKKIETLENDLRSANEETNELREEELLLLQNTLIFCPETQTFHCPRPAMSEMEEGNPMEIPTIL